MKIKNISNKPISFGEFGILPNETKNISDSYAKNPVVDMYKRRKFISVIGETNTLSNTEDDVNDGKITDSIYSGMSAAALRKECKERDIKYKSKDKNDILIALLLEHDEKNIDEDKPPANDNGEYTGDSSDDFDDSDDTKVVAAGETLE